ncbi:hypothetical protein DFH29DRAFT_1082712 [Suillus ampliporus]|nr:hypothetical protein DFH29DRAFT_1082712 [Suillus ampliporus]
MISVSLGSRRGTARVRRGTARGRGGTARGSRGGIALGSRRGTALVEQRLAHINEEIAASESLDMAELAESSSILRSRRNALACISSLPSELLATIFTHILEEQVFDRCRGIHRQGVPTWEIVTHVCRHWRQVALACPTLWTFIDHAPARRLTIMLERSKTAALVVFYTSSYLHCIGQVLSQLPRIKVLQLSVSSRDVDRISDCLSSQPAPLLETFKLYVLERPGIVRPISDAFQGRAPRLRSVELTNCTFSWTSGIFSGLRTLALRHIGVYTLSQLLSALRRMPGLEQLILKETSTSSEGAEAFDQVPLTHLKSMELDFGNAQFAISLFSHLTLPVDVKITLNQTRLESPQNFRDLLSVMYKNPDESGPVIRSLYISIVNHTFSVALSTVAFKHGQMWNPRDGDSRLSLRFYCYAPTLLPVIIFDICRMVPYCHIQSLFVVSTLDLPESFWRAGCAELRELASVHLDCHDIGGLIATLQNGGTQSSDIVYPLFHALELRDVNFGCDEPEALRDIVAMRAKHGMGIDKLRLVECWNLRDDGVQLLKAVTDVDWDGHQAAWVDPRCPGCGNLGCNVYGDGDMDSEED